MNSSPFFKATNAAFNGAERLRRVEDAAVGVVKQTVKNRFLSRAGLALTGAGILASAYAPHSLGGPGEGDKQFSTGRAAEDALLYTGVGGAIMGIPRALSIARGQLPATKLRRLGNGLSAGVGLVAAGSLINDARQGAIPDVRAASSKSQPLSRMHRATTLAEQAPPLWDMLTNNT